MDDEITNGQALIELNHRHLEEDNQEHERNKRRRAESGLCGWRIDGGYGWVMVAAAFMIHFISDGLGFSFGIMYPVIQQQFNTSKGTGAWVGSLFYSIPSLAAPIASYIIDKYGYRFACIIGGLIAALGVFLSVFADSLVLLCVTFGLVCSSGLCLTFAGAIVAVTMSFDKRRAFATGLTVSGTGIGTFVMAPIVEWLIREYGWNGCLLILSAFMLNLIVFGLLIRDLPDYMKQEYRGSVNCLVMPTPEVILITPDGTTQRIETRLRSKSDTTEQKMMSNLAENGEEDERCKQIVASSHPDMNINDNHLRNHVQPAMPSMLAFSASSNTRISRIPKYGEYSCGFMLFVVNSFILYCFCDIPYVNVPEYAVEHLGVTDAESSYIVSLIGIVNIPAMIGFGLMSDWAHINTSMLYGISCLICGVSLLVVPWLPTYTALMCSCAIFGITISANYTLSSVLVAKLLPISCFTSGYGLVSFAEGIGMLVGPALAGYLYDVTGNYTTTFVVGGLGTILSGLLMFVIEFTKCCPSQ